VLFSPQTLPEKVFYKSIGAAGVDDGGYLKEALQPPAPQDTAVVTDRRTTGATEPRHSPIPVSTNFATLFWDEPKSSRLIQNQVVQLARTMQVCQRGGRATVIG